MIRSLALDYRAAVPERDKPIAMVVGRTGVGKSSLINHVFGHEVACVNDVASQTLETQAYIFENRLYVIDTRGLEEAGASVEAEEQLVEALSRESPHILMYVLDGGRRDGLDEEMKSLDRVLARAFANVFAEPKLFVVVNKVDNLSPAGSDTLPKVWPGELDTEKGKNIHKRVGQIYDVSWKYCRNEIIAIAPTALEWYDGAQPWNLAGLRNSLSLAIDDGEIELLKRFALGKDELPLLLKLETALLEADIETSPNAERDGKKSWQARWQQKVFERMPTVLGDQIRDCRLSPSLRLPTDPVRRAVFLLELILFEPYIRFSKEDPPLKRNTKAWEENLRARLAELGADLDEVSRLHASFQGNLKALVGGKNWLFIIGAALLGILLGWWAAPIIGGWIGALMGLEGASAVSAGLAWLGFGSLTVGGFGMFGGTVVLMGGGALLAAGASATFLSEYAKTLSRARAILDGAKSLTIFQQAIVPTKDQQLILAFARHVKKSLFDLIRQLSSNDQAGKIIPVLEKVNKRLSELRHARTKSFFRREQGVKS
ncbi:MAG: GTPase domain-containing protein [Candidatus Ozemobacteraceae bacterium]